MAAPPRPRIVRSALLGPVVLCTLLDSLARAGAAGGAVDLGLPHTRAGDSLEGELSALRQ